MKRYNFNNIYFKLISLILLSIFLSQCLISCEIEMPTSLPTNVSTEIQTTESSIGVSWDKEIRGIYIASVNNINFPSKPGLSVSQLKDEINTIIEEVKAIGFNTIYFQVRPTGDALYDSEIFPSSRYLVGTEGNDPGMDVLAYFIEKAKSEGIDIIAWVNPYRVTNGSFMDKNAALMTLSEQNPAKIHPDWTVFYGGRLYYDPALPEVRDLIARGLKELCQNYDIRGILYDDYFYPYPVSGMEFDDTSSYAIYGNGMELSDWRRDNVNQMVKLSFDTIKSANPSLSFGVSPFGIWRNISSDPQGSNTRGLESYSSLYCDTLAWIEGEYIDYISPQIYWEKGYTVADFNILCHWWSEKLEGSSVRLCISHAAYKAGSFQDGGAEIARQIKYSKNYSSSSGCILYGFADIQRNTAEIQVEIKALFSNANDRKEANS